MTVIVAGWRDPAAMTGRETDHKRADATPIGLIITARAARSLSWASSPAYGGTVALGPVQRSLLDLLLDMTAGDRRPELTLAELAARLGRAISSVHEAIGRLRALGLIGVAARMGRNGGHRIWRIRKPATRSLDPERHRRAVARLVGRFTTQALSRSASDGGEDHATGPTDPPAPPLPADPSMHEAPADPLGDLRPSAQRPILDPFGVPYAARPADAGGRPPASPQTFGDKLRHYGLGSWIDERRHG